MKWFFCLFYHPLPVFCPVPSLIQTIPQKHVSALKNFLQKTYVAATGFKSEKDQTNNFSPF